VLNLNLIIAKYTKNDPERYGVCQLLFVIIFYYLRVLIML